MEAIHASGRARLLGISNVTLEQLQSLSNEARVRPHFVQNRCYAAQGWDRRIRRFCAANGAVYQGFSLLTANPNVTADRETIRIAERHGRTVSQLVFRFALDVGMLPLTGTTDAEHMGQDLDVFDFSASSPRTWRRSRRLWPREARPASPSASRRFARVSGHGR